METKQLIGIINIHTYFASRLKRKILSEVNIVTHHLGPRSDLIYTYKSMNILLNNYLFSENLINQNIDESCQ